MYRRNRSGWILSALVIVAIVMFRARMVPNILIPYGPNHGKGDYQFTAVMRPPAKQGLGWVLTRRSDQTQYVVELYQNQSPKRSFATIRSTTAQPPGRTYHSAGTLKIDGTEYQAALIAVDPSGTRATITFVPVKPTSKATG